MLVTAIMYFKILIMTYYAEILKLDFAIVL